MSVRSKKSIPAHKFIKEDQKLLREMVVHYNIIKKLIPKINKHDKKLGTKAKTLLRHLEKSNVLNFRGEELYQFMSHSDIHRRLKNVVSAYLHINFKDMNWPVSPGLPSLIVHKNDYLSFFENKIKITPQELLASKKIVKNQIACFKVSHSALRRKRVDVVFCGPGPQIKDKHYNGGQKFINYNEEVQGCTPTPQRQRASVEREGR